MSFVISDENRADFARMREEFEASEARMQALNPLLRALRNQLGAVQHELFFGGEGDGKSGPLLDEVFTRVDQVLEIVGDDLVLREGWITDVLDSVARIRALQHFLRTGTLVPHTDLTLARRVKDEEYLGGVMGLSQDLSRWAIQRAAQMDVGAVSRCRDLLTALNGKLLEFDFRNGGLRRKYDAVKWGVRRMEDLLYELSVVGVFPPAPMAQDENASNKQEQEGELVPLQELEAIRVRLAAHDETREAVIKACRDVQKNSKNAVYSVHRHDLEKAQTLLDAAKEGALSLTPHLTAHPTLRFGSYEAAMEEYAEAAQYLAWRAHGRLPTKVDIGIVNSVEYIGGLVDFTGEMGRFAVARATARDAIAVKACMAMNVYIGGELVRTTLPGKIAKKMNDLRNNSKKLETLSYELALIKAGKGAVAGVEGAKDRGGEGEGEGGGGGRGGGGKEEG